jgi:predicted nucleotidyltransferase
MVMTMHNISSIKSCVEPIAKDYGIKKIYLFGSYAKGTADENSDVDLLVEKGKSLSLLKLSGLRQALEETLNTSVDLVTTGGIEKDFYEAIAGTELLLYEE